MSSHLHRTVVKTDIACHSVRRIRPFLHKEVAMTPKLALFLRGYRAEREDLYQQLGKSLSLDDLVFASVEGKPIDPCVLCPMPSIE